MKHGFVAAVALCALVAASPQAVAQPEGPPIRTSQWTTLRSTIEVPELTEALLVEGRLHVVSDLAAGGLVDVHANLVDMRATGVSSRRTFNVTGSDAATLVSPGPSASVGWQPGFALQPEGPPIRLALELTYDAAGRLSQVRELHATGDGSHD